MKKILFSVMACLLGMSNAMADELIISDVNLPADGTVELPVDFKAAADGVNVGFKFNLVLPEGISTVKDDEDGLPLYDQNNKVIRGYTIVATENNAFAGLNMSSTSATIKGTEGNLITLYLKTDKVFEVGTKLTATVTNAAFTAKNANGVLSTVNLDDFTFTITIVPGTGINSVKGNSKASSLYTIDGKKISNKGLLHKGVYVKDGKKVVVK